ncbi:hypothetical protein NE237_000296 [Protea cynaroides]|uniref:Uncharacterized protein n=1 Tax=Protea cynaroides TaxID=273540 RepID=A0A9Q0QX06_9MAGN|nr:hypothetical protein NE237_000296 [Protea cynaroides]
MLMSLHVGLEKHKGQSSINGSTMLLLFFALTYLDKLLGFTKIPERSNLDFPMFFNWFVAMAKPSKDVHFSIKQEVVVAVLRSLNNKYISRAKELTGNNVQHYMAFWADQINARKKMNEQIWIAGEDDEVGDEMDPHPVHDMGEAVRDEDVEVESPFAEGEDHDLASEANILGIEEDPHLMTDVVETGMDGVFNLWKDYMLILIQ